ncbi:MAG TPA: hypothetical protein VG839_07735 [Asticcacaulis sp.]|nr:hypothetical protein [Asticcacaulis sp.]
MAWRSSEIHPPVVAIFVGCLLCLIGAYLLWLTVKVHRKQHFKALKHLLGQQEAQRSRLLFWALLVMAATCLISALAGFGLPFPWEGYLIDAE